MNNKFSIAIYALLVLLCSCQKDEYKAYYEGGVAPVLTANRSNTILLSFADAEKEAIKLTWTNPEYQFSTGVSSQDVTYVVELDTTGANFTNPNKQTVSVSKNLTLLLTNTQLNDYLLNQLRLKPGQPHNIEFRITSMLTNNSVPLASNVLKFTATPYAIPPKVAPPASGELYITGDAVASGWVNNPPAAQKFTKKSDTFYELTVALSGGKSYTFLPVNGSWDSKYSIATKNDPALVNGGDFQWQGNDILAPAASGNYKIEVDFQRGKFTVTKL